MTARPHTPSTSLLAASYLLTGLGVALLGPILPLLKQEWMLSDSGVGMLPMAQFLGSFAGGMTTLRRPERSFLLGSAAATVGFGVFAVAGELPLACAALFGGNWGLGQMITSNNIIAGSRFAERRGVALTLLNFVFSAGAVLSPLLASWLTPVVALPRLLMGLAALFAVLALSSGFQMRRTVFQEVGDAGQQTLSPGISYGLFAFYAAILILYGAFETSISIWLTSYVLRYGDATLRISQLSTSGFWVALTVARGAASGLLLRIGEKLLQRVSLTLVSIAVGALLIMHSIAGIIVCAILIGIFLSPVFPISFALLMHHRPSSRQAGIIIAVSALGAAALPSLMGVVSRSSGSLRVAFCLPLLAVLALLGMSLSSREA